MKSEVKTYLPFTVKPGVLSFKELMRSVGAFPFLLFQQKRENQSNSAISASLAKPRWGGTSGRWGKRLIPFFKYVIVFTKQCTKSIVRSQGSEVRSQKTEVRNQESE
jgi:hypothetical protein